MGSKKIQVKDTVPPHKSQTRGAVARAQLAKAPAASKQVGRPQVKVIPSKQTILRKSAKASANSAGMPLPHANPSRGFSKPKTGTREDQIHRRLKKKSPWFQSINDPKHGAGAKIPDETGVDTGTVQLVQSFTGVANEHGVIGLAINPYPNHDQDTYDTPPGTPFADGVNYRWTTPESVPATGIAFHYGTEGVGGAGPLAGIGEVIAVSNECRVVSASLTAQPEMSMTENSGDMTVFTIPFEILGPSSRPLVAWQKIYKSAVIPVNSGKVAVAKWYPITRMDMSFKSFVQTEGQVEDFIFDTDNRYPGYWLGAICAGLPEGAPVRFEATINLELVPRVNTLNLIGASPSPQDVQEVDLVEKWVQDMPTSAAVSPASVSSSATSVTPNHGENDAGLGLGMIANIIGEVAPFLSELAPYALALI